MSDEPAIPDTHAASLVLKELVSQQRQRDKMNGLGANAKGEDHDHEEGEKDEGKDGENDPLETTISLLYTGPTLAPSSKLDDPIPPPRAWENGILSHGKSAHVEKKKIRGNERWTPRGSASEKITSNWSNTLSGPIVRASTILDERRRISTTYHPRAAASKKVSSSTIETHNQNSRFRTTTCNPPNSPRKQNPTASRQPSRAKSLDLLRIRNLRQRFGHDALESTVDLLFDADSKAMKMPTNEQSCFNLPLPSAIWENGRTARRIVCMDSASVSEFVNSSSALNDDEASKISHFSLIKDHDAPVERRISLPPLVPFLSRLKCLRTLVLRRLNFTDIPQELTCLAQTLVTLDAAHNCLRQWPKVLSSMANLQILDLSHNALDVPPEFCCGALKKLRVFKLSRNNLLRCPSEIETFLYPTLEELYLDRNCLTVIPSSVGIKFSKLRIFTCFDNPFLHEEDRKLSKAGFSAIRKAKSKKHLSKNPEIHKYASSSGHQGTVASKDRKPGKFGKKKIVNRIKNAPTVGGNSSREDEFRTQARIKRGKLTRVWDLRVYGSDSHLPSVLFENVTGIQEVLVTISQLPFLVQNDSPAAQVELSSVWRLVYSMREIVALWVFPCASSGIGNSMSKLSAITRQLSLVFNIANQGSAYRRGEMAWRFTIYRRMPSPN